MKNEFNFKTFIKPILFMLLGAVVSFAIVLVSLGVDFKRIPQQLILAKKVIVTDKYIKEKALNKVEKADDIMLSAYVNALNDDYAEYLDSNGFSLRQEEWQGESTAKMGINIAKNPKTKLCTVIYVNSLSPAKEAGIKVGDAIIKINGKDVSKLSSDKQAQMCVGKTGEKVKIQVQRKDKVFNFTVVLGNFVSDSVSYKMLSKKIGYIKIITFNDTTYEQFMSAYKALSDKKAKALIFDLRNNGGGTVESCAKIIDEICPKGDTVRFKDKSGDIRVEYSSDENEIKLPMAVLVNKNTASASEIFAMNIRDFKKGKLVGTKTYGKGIAQTTFELCDGTAIKFTTESVVDKNGKSYHKKGLNPDITVNLGENELKNYYFLTEKDDLQLIEAIKSIG